MATENADKQPTKAAVSTNTSAKTSSSNGDHSYTVPLVHTHVPDRAVEIGFWGGLAGAALLGAVDPPLALLVGAGVLVARHHHS